MDAQPPMPLEIQFFILAKNFHISYTDFMLNIPKEWRLTALDLVKPDEADDTQVLKDLME